MDQKSKREERRDDTQYTNTKIKHFYLLYFFKIVCGTRVPGVQVPGIGGYCIQYPVY